jgi:hypothetical protein
MNEQEYKERLLKRVLQYFGDQYILVRSKPIRIDGTDSVVVRLYPIGEEKAAIDYYPYEATVFIPSLNYKEEGIIKEKVVELFRKHFGE